MDTGESRKAMRLVFSSNDRLKSLPAGRRKPIFTQEPVQSKYCTGSFIILFPVASAAMEIQ